MKLSAQSELVLFDNEREAPCFSPEDTIVKEVELPKLLTGNGSKTAKASAAKHVAHIKAELLRTVADVNWKSALSSHIKIILKKIEETAVLNHN